MSISSEHAPVQGERLRLLRSLGYGELMHDSHVPFLSHLIGTRRLLVEWGCRPALCDAGLFHSAYGTEFFEPPRPATREQVRAIIGTDAERLAWLWCNVERATLHPQQRTVVLRHTQSTTTLARAELADIATLWAADTVEQIARMTAEERTFADGLRGRVAPLACHAARQALDDLDEAAP